MKTKRNPKSLIENLSQKLDRQKQLQAMKKQLIRKAREHQKEVEKSIVNR